MNGRCLKLSANIAALAIFTFAVWRVGSMITPEKIVASCNSPSRVADELNDAVRLVRGGYRVKYVLRQGGKWKNFAWK